MFPVGVAGSCDIMFFFFIRGSPRVGYSYNSDLHINNDLVYSIVGVSLDTLTA